MQRYKEKKETEKVKTMSDDEMRKLYEGEPESFQLVMVPETG
jgi:hypothetical protein